MKVLYSGTLDVNAGGPAMSTYNTLYGLNKIGVNAEIIMYPLSPNGKLRGQEVKVNYAHAPLEQKLAYSPYLKKEIKQLGIYDLYHAQGIWQYPTYALIDVAKSFNKPYIITPRGMLYPQDINKSNKLIKLLSLKLRLLKDFNKAACVHVTCHEEMEHCRNIGITSPIAIIANPIEIKEYKRNKYDGTFRLGYLGRLSPRKNVESLIYAIDKLKTNKRRIELIIIGGGDIEYTNFLKKEVRRLELDDIVKFKGFLSGIEKDEALSTISVLAMPSEFENLGNVILEGLLRGIPCIATKGSPWQELKEYNCGWWIDYNQESITNAIKEALNTEETDLELMGNRGNQLVKNKYSIESISNKMEKLYKAILNNQLKKLDFCYYNE